MSIIQNLKIYRIKLSSNGFETNNEEKCIQYFLTEKLFKR